MGFDIPNSTDVPQTAVYGNGAMAKPFRSDIAIIEAALEGYRPVSGCQVTPGTNVGTVQVAAGTAIFADQAKTVAAANNIACCANADTTNPKWILYELDTSQVLQANIGTANANPIPPTPTAGRVVLAAVFVPANATQVDAAISVATGSLAKIIDKRAARSISNDYQFYKPTYQTVTDGVTRNTSTTWNGGAINLNTLTGTQNATLTSTAGLPTSGAVVLVHAATDYVITYNGISGNNLQNSTSYTANTGAAAPNVTVANGDAVSNNKIITSATASYWPQHYGSYITGSGTQIQTKGTAAAQLGMALAIPGGGGYFGYVAAGTLATGSALTLTTAQLAYNLVAVPGIKSLDVWAIAAGGGGCSGAVSANITTNANGGGGGGPGGVSHFTISAVDALQDGATVLNFVTTQGGRGGATAGGAANAGGDGGQPYMYTSATHIIQLAGPGKGATSTTGGNNGWGTESAAGSTYKGGNGAVGGTGAATTGYSSKDVGPCTPPGGGGGGGLTGSGSAYLAAAGGGNGWDIGFVGNSANGGGAGGQGNVGGNGNSASFYSTSFPIFGGGGGGGGGRNTNNVNGGAGGTGGNFGAGGGGGGNACGTGLAGAGGDGGDGCILVIVNA